MLYPDHFQEQQKDQCYALLNLIGQFIQQHKNPRVGLPPGRLQTLAQIAIRLQVFACQQINFFDQAPLDHKTEFPKEYIFGLIHDQVARDFTVLREAACQRSSNDENFIKTLSLADKLAAEIVLPLIETNPPKYVRDWSEFPFQILNNRNSEYAAQESRPDQQMPSNLPGKGLSLELLKFRPPYKLVAGSAPIFAPKTIVFTYFRKFPAIRLIPYANVALIGIPFTAVYRPQDLLATPHEIGHQVFWRWRELRVIAEEMRRSLPVYAYHWAEEIFADTFGVLTAGPAAALFAQLLESSFDSTHFLQDDGAHPVSVLRPFVHLKALNDPANPIIKELSNDWNSYRKVRSDTALEFDNPGHGKVRIDNAVGKRGQDEYHHRLPVFPVDKLVDKFQELLATRTKVGNNPWWMNPPAADTADLYPKFKQHLQDLDLTHPVDELADEPAITDLLKLSYDQISYKDPSWAAVVEPFLEEEPNKVLGKASIPPQDWLPLMDMDAWADKGPTSNPRGD